MSKIDKSKVCFITAAIQKNYVDQFNNKVNNLPKEFDFNFYVLTDLPQDITTSYPKLTVLNFYDIKKRTPETDKYETVDGSTALTSYPNNTRRHIIKRALDDGFKYIIWNDNDVSFNKPIDELLLYMEKFKINSIYTQNSIYRNKENSDGTTPKPFDNCDKVINHFNFDIDKKDLKIHDGPTCIYYLDTKVSSKFIKTWDKVTEYAYQNPYAHKGGHERPSVEVYAIAVAQLNIDHITKQLFRVDHDFSIKY